MHTMDGVYESKSGRGIAYKVEFAVEGQSFQWSGRAQFHDGDWLRIPGGSMPIFDPVQVEEEAHAAMRAAIED